MYGILGEDDSDIQVLQKLIRRISKNERTRIKDKAYSGCGDLLSKGARGIQALSDLGISKFIICYDSDRANPNDRFNEIAKRIIKPSGVKSTFCTLIPVQEIESWFLSDLDAVKKIFDSFKSDKNFANPENQNDPKQMLEKLLRREDNKPRYSGSIHNPQIAEHINLEKLVMKCPSSLPLFELILNGNGNYPPRQDDWTKRRNNIIDMLKSSIN